MSSIKDVAEMAQVSIATVSRYINSPERVRAPTAKRVQEAIEITGYKTNTLARNFRMGKTQQVMVVLPSIGIPFYGPIVEGVRKVADSVGYHILVMETAFNSVEFDDFTRLVISKQTDGIILLSTLSPFKETNTSTNGVRPPIVLGLESIAAELSHFPCVCINNESAAHDATQYLIGLGHRNIGFLHGLTNPGTELTKARADGFRKAMAAQDIPVNEDWVIKAPISVEGGRQAARQLLTCDSRPSAIFCANDEMALGAMFELKKAGLRVPEDVSVMGFDNMLYSEISDPPLTTIEQPADKIGEYSMRRLLQLIAGETVGNNMEIIPHRLVERQSCTKPGTGK
ncbi:MAG TPA: LacI family DNA-binding transcriptional regulator [Gammaproteobacteria bacterium]|nr:LacI family DNA-binding transcriptional regulator [Gammaproteobacteria bacterium]